MPFTPEEKTRKRYSDALSKGEEPPTPRTAANVVLLAEVREQVDSRGVAQPAVVVPQAAAHAGAGQRPEPCVRKKNKNKLKDKNKANGKANGKSKYKLCKGADKSNNKGREHKEHSGAAQPAALREDVCCASSGPCLIKFPAAAFAPVESQGRVSSLNKDNEQPVMPRWLQQYQMAPATRDQLEPRWLQPLAPGGRLGARAAAQLKELLEFNSWVQNTS